MIKNVKVSTNMKNIKHKIILVTTPVILSLTMTACSFDFMHNTEPTYPVLDKSKIDYNVDMRDRKDYYNENVEVIMAKMSEEELDAYYIDVNIKYIGTENIEKDDILFLRSDNRIVSNADLDDNCVQIYPGLYQIITSQGSVGDMEALTPGKEIDLTIDYNTKSITYTEKDKTPDDTKEQTNHKSK